MTPPHVVRVRYHRPDLAQGRRRGGGVLAIALPLACVAPGTIALTAVPVAGCSINTDLCEGTVRTTEPGDDAPENCTMIGVIGQKNTRVAYCCAK